MIYFLHDGKERTGPFSLNDLEKVQDRDGYHVWYEDLKEWQPLPLFFKTPQNIYDEEIKKTKVETVTIAKVNNGSNSIVLPESNEQSSVISNSWKRDCVYVFSFLCFEYFSSFLYYFISRTVDAYSEVLVFTKFFIDIGEFLFLGVLIFLMKTKIGKIFVITFLLLEVILFFIYNPNILA